MDTREPTEEPPDNRLGLGFLVGFGVGIVLLGAAWLVVAVAGDDSGDAEGTSAEAHAGEPFSSAASAAPSGSPSAATSSSGPTRMERCTSAANALRPPLRASGPAIDQWEVHVGAMNKLVTGAITLQQATAFWNQTRVGAQRQIAHFRDALATLRRHGVDCPAPVLLPPASSALRACVRQVAADVQALRAARTSVATWDEHVRHMEMLRTGKMSPATATRMWLSLWHQGVRELDAYRTNLRAAHRAGGCETAPTDAMPSESGSPSMQMGGSH